MFGVDVVTECPGLPAEILLPRNAWADRSAYDATARPLADLFNEDFTKYAEGVTAAIKAAGPNGSTSVDR